MTKEKEQELFREFVNEMEEITNSKGQDYATDEDRMKNFRLVAAIADIPPSKVFMVMLATKIVRLGILSGNGKIPNHESLHDTRIDLANYSFLWEAFELEEFFADKWKEEIEAPPVFPLPTSDPDFQ